MLRNTLETVVDRRLKPRSIRRRPVSVIRRDRLHSEQLRGNDGEKTL